MMHYIGKSLCKIVSDKQISKRCHYSRFLIGPVERGQAISYGTSIRRILLSLRGPHISSITIRNLTHEFGNIIGVRESVNEILTNFSKIVVLDSGEYDMLSGQNDRFTNTYQTVNIQVKGPGILTANAIDLQAPFSIVDKDQYIASIETDIILNIVLCIKSDKYQNIKASAPFPFSTFILESNNQVVSNVNLNVISLENFDEECLVLEVWTNAGITPARAIRLSASIACSFYKGFLSIDDSLLRDNSISGGRIRTSE